MEAESSRKRTIEDVEKSQTIVESQGKETEENQNVVEEEGEVCSICFSEIEVHEAAQLDSCNHLFHFPCITPWVKESATCPYCRHPISEVIDPKTGQRLDCTACEKGDSGEDDISVVEDVVDAVCYICNGNDREDELLLCEGHDGQCTRGGHLDCCGLDAVPEGDWYCDQCRAPTERNVSRQGIPAPAPIQTTRVPRMQRLNGRRGRRSPTYRYHYAEEGMAEEENEMPIIPGSVSGSSSSTSSSNGTSGGNGVVLIQLTPRELAQRMEDASSMDNGSTLEHRSKLLPLVVQYLSHWRNDELRLGSKVGDSGIVAAMAHWLYPERTFEQGQHAERLRFALLQQLRFIGPKLSYQQVMDSRIGEAIGKCFVNTEESERNKAMQRAILKAFQAKVKRRLQVKRGNLRLSQDLRDKVQERSRITTKVGSPIQPHQVDSNDLSRSLPGSMKTIRADTVGARAIRDLMARQEQELMRRQSAVARGPMTGPCPGAGDAKPQMSRQEEFKRRRSSTSSIVKPHKALTLGEKRHVIGSSMEAILLDVVFPAMEKHRDIVCNPEKKKKLAKITTKHASNQMASAFTLASAKSDKELCELREASVRDKLRFFATFTGMGEQEMLERFKALVEFSIPDLK